MSETPIELDNHRGMAAQKATDIRRVLADVEANAKLLRDHQAAVELQLLAVPATSLAGGGRQGVLRFESVCGRSRTDRYPSPRPRYGGAFRPYPACRRELNETDVRPQQLKTSPPRVRCKSNDPTEST